MELQEFGNVRFNLDWSYMNEFEKDGLGALANMAIQNTVGYSAQPGLKVRSMPTNISFVGEFEDTPDIDFDGVLDFEENTRERLILKCWWTCSLVTTTAITFAL